MKKLLTLFIICNFSAFVAQNTYWKTETINQPEPEATKLGTSNFRSIHFAINDTTRFILDSTTRTLRFPDFYTNEDDNSERALVIDNKGNVFPMGRTANWVETPPPSKSCDPRNLPWYWGGNHVTGNNNKIGTCNNKSLLIVTSSTPRIVVDSNGFVAVGSNPNQVLNSRFTISDGAVGDELHFNPDRIFTTNDLSLNGKEVIFTSSDNMAMEFPLGKSLSLIQNNMPKFGITSSGKTFAGHQTGATNSSQFNINVNGATNAPINSFDIYDQHTNKVNFRVLSNGKTNIGNEIGSTNNAFLNLNVAGGSTSTNAFDIFDQHTNKVNFRVKSDGFVYLREINIRLSNFPDYVFKPDYKLRSLESLEQFIDLNGHLPGVPDAKEINTNGGNIGELIKIQFEKIEELTLYIIELKKIINSIPKER
jgi:hypothetical protein